MTGPNRENQIAQVRGHLSREARALLASGYPAAAVIEALRREADQMSGDDWPDNAAEDWA